MSEADTPHVIRTYAQTLQDQDKKGSLFRTFAPPSGNVLPFCRASLM